jgi:integrase
MPKRLKTKYPGVFYREAERVGGTGLEKVYYVLFKKDGRLIEEKVGRQFADDMTPARAAVIRSRRIEGKRESRKRIREQKEAEKKAVRWTVKMLYEKYTANRPDLKGIATYNSQFNKYLDPEFGHKEPAELAPLDIDRLRLKMAKTKSPSYVRGTLELLRRIINYGVKKQIVSPVGFQIELPIVDDKKTEDLTPGQLHSLLEAIEADPHPHAGPMMLMALYSGMRKGELLRLKWTHINFERGFITLVDTKGGKDQEIPLNDSARQLLKSLPQKGVFVFFGKDREQRRQITKQVARIRDEAGLPASFRPLHGLRHVFASGLASSGKVDLYVLQRLLTHRDPKMTQRYAHLRDEALKKASNLAGDIIQQASTTRDNLVSVKKD